MYVYECDEYPFYITTKVSVKTYKHLSGGNTNVPQTTFLN